MFSQHFAFELPALANFVGGGGKTGLILTLLEEHSSPGPVLYTTTARMHPPHLQKGMALIACDNTPLLRRMVEGAARTCSDRVSKLVATGDTIVPRLLRGVPPDFAGSFDHDLFTFILNEADGARSMSLKMPRDNEPILMQGAKYLVPVIGLDCLRRPLGPETLFRWEMAQARFGLKAGQIVTPELAASLLLHPEGVCKGWRPGTQIIPYINKVDVTGDESMARELAQALLQNRHFQVHRVVWGSLLKARAESLAAHVL